MGKKLLEVLFKMVIKLFNPTLLRKLGEFAKKKMSVFYRAGVGYMLAEVGLEWMSDTRIPAVDEAVEKMRDVLKDVRKIIELLEGSGDE